VAPLEDGVVHHLVEQHREVEDREALDERQRDPDRGVVETDETPGAEAQQGELPGRDEQVSSRHLAVQLPQLPPVDRGRQVGMERSDVPAVVMSLDRHGRVHLVMPESLQSL